MEKNRESASETKKSKFQYIKDLVEEFNAMRTPKARKLQLIETSETLNAFEFYDV